MKDTQTRLYRTKPPNPPPPQPRHQLPRRFLHIHPIPPRTLERALPPPQPRQLAIGRVDVAHGGLHVAVAQPLLDGLRRPAGGGEVGGEGVAENVEAHAAGAGLEAGGAEFAVEDLRDGAAVQRAAAAGEEEPRAARGDLAADRSPRRTSRAGDAVEKLRVLCCARRATRSLAENLEVER